MRYMVLVKADTDTEAGDLPSEKDLAEMGSYNEQLMNAGVLLAADGLHPTSRGAKIRFFGDQRTVIDGPFAETNELIAGFWLWQVDSRDDAIEWAKRAPFRRGEVEIRQVFDADVWDDRERIRVDATRYRAGAVADHA